MSRAEERILDGSVWNDFCDQLKSLGDLVCRPESPGDVLNRALGYRYLTRLLRGGLESAVDYADPQYPAFFRLADETKGVLNDNPDSYYQNCVIDGRFDYRIRGTAFTVPWFSIGTKSRAVEVKSFVSTGEIDSRNMVLEEDGSFEILVSAKEKPGNWLPCTEESGMIIVRQNFGDRSKETVSQLSIECLNPERPHNTLVPEDLEASLQRALGFVSSTVDLNVDWMERYKRLHFNALPADDQAACHAAGGDPNIHYYQSWWCLAPDEALLVHLQDIPDSQTWNLQISTYWMESLDYRFFPISVNKFTAHYEDDGSVYIVIAHEDPGPRYRNWLDTCGHDQGGMLGRFVGSPNPPPEMPSKIVKLSELKGG